VVGLGSGFFLDFDFDQPAHTFQEIIDGGYYTHHNPDGAYYYAADISVHPDYRGKGIGRLLYNARKDLVRRYQKKGIVGGGVLPGYAQYKGKFTVAEYVEQVVDGALFDPTLTFQLRNGFQVRGLLEGYIDDSASDGWATLIFWPNPDYM
jgi:GNAT superfamily N-acetyltransferase